jgi:hypothetical protein
MTKNEIIEAAIQGHASTRDAINWAIEATIKECAEIGDDYDDESMGNYGITDVKTAGEAIRETFEGQS